MKFNTKRYFQVLGITLAVILGGVLVVLGFGFTDGFKLPEENDETVAIEGGKINVLLMGVDEEGLRTDAIMVASYNTDTNEVKMLSIPRDTRMFIGSRYQKINAAHALSDGNGKIKGAQATVEAVTRLTGIPINYYVDFSFKSIEDAIDILGPVTFEIPDLYDDGVGMVYDDPSQNLHINLKPGLQELNGEQVVHLLRYRKGNKDPKTGVRHGYANGDIDRIAVQQDFLRAFVDQKLNASLILKIPAIFKQLSKDIDTNLTTKDIMKYSKYLNDFKSTGITAFSLPGKSSGDEYTESFWICDLDATRELIETEFGYDASNITIDEKPSDKNTESGKADTNSSAKSTGTKQSATVNPQKTSKPSQTKKPSSSTSSSKTQKPQTSTSNKTEKPNSSNSSGSNDTKNEVTNSTKTEAPKKTDAPNKTQTPEKTKVPVKYSVEDDNDQ